MLETIRILETIAVEPTSASRIRRRMLFGAKLAFWSLLLLTLAALALQFGAWREQFKIAGPFEPETNPARHSLIFAVPQEARASWWKQPMLGDDTANPFQSVLELWINGREMGLPHTPHETIRDGKTAGFSHWGSGVIFSLPEGINNGPETIATLRYSVRPWAPVTWVLTVASALLGWFLFGSAFVSRFGPAFVSRIWGLLSVRLIFWPLAMLALMAVALQLGAWHTEYQIAGPFAAATNPPGASLVLTQEEPAWWMQLGDDAANPFQSDLELRINGREMGPPHTPHETIRDGKTAGFSHWGSGVIFSLPEGINNGPETIATLRYSVRPWAPVTWVLTVASALLGWFLFAERHGKLILRGPYLILAGFCWAGLVASAIFVGCSLYALATGWALPTTALIRWSAIARWAANNEPNLGYLLLMLAGLGTTTTWLIGSSARHQPSVQSNEQSLQRLLARCGFPIAACAFAFCVSAMWAGVVRPGDPNRLNIGGLIPFSDAANYLTASYDQVKDGVWNTQALRRPLAAAFKSVLLVFGNFSLQYMLILQACLVAAAVCFATYAIIVWRGVWAGIAFFALTYIYARFFVPTTNTEPLGMFWALLSIPFFIKAFRNRSVKAALVAFAMTTVALMTRMGSMFTLPALLVWLVWQFGQTATAKFRIFAVAICIVLSIFGLNSMLQKAYGTGPNPSTGNFPYVFCGLSMGTTWDGCMKKLASEGIPLEGGEDARATQMFSMALENLRAQPGIFFRRLADGAQAFVTELPGLFWKGYGPLEEPDWLLRNALTAISLIGLLYGAARRAKSVERTFWTFFGRAS